MNYNGEDVELAQHNMDVAIPFVVSTRNYGLLWDNNSITRFGNPEALCAGRRGDLKVRRATASRAGPRATTSASSWRVDAAGSRRSTISISATRRTGRPRPRRRPRRRTAAEHAAWSSSAWSGPARVDPDTTGLHRFRLYASSYVKVYVDGKWCSTAGGRTGTPGTTISTLPMTAGKPVEIRIEWEPNGGYIALLHNDPLPERRPPFAVASSSEAGKAIDYYFVGGDDMDEVIAGYRELTGKAVLMPHWAYGFWQSRQRYETQDQLLGVVREYRKRGMPLDNIVQDWFYWPEDHWGCHCFDPTRFPDPKAMVDEVHALNAHIMISVWPKFYPNTDNYKELDAKGYIYQRQPRGRRASDWVGPGYLNTFYDPYIPKARATSTGARCATGCVELGFDAWWLDRPSRTSIPTSSIEERARAMARPRSGRAPPIFNTYPLMHATASYEGLRAAKPDMRAVHPHPLGLRRHPARRRGGVVGRRRRALGRSARPDLGRRELLDVGRAQLDPRYRRLRDRGRASRTQRPGGAATNGASSTCAGSSSAPSRRCSAAMARCPTARSTNRAGRTRRCTTVDGVLRPAALPADALYLHAGRRHLSPRRHDHARPGDGLPGRPQGAGTSTTNICSARPSWSRR